MITPAYSLTANERVLPCMALDFTTASLDSRVTVTRALNTATRINSSGAIEIVNANLPRFDFDPVSKVCKGLLIEEARVNLARYSQTFDSSWWAQFNIGLDINAVNSPLGTNTACKLKTNTTAGIHLTFSNVAASVAGNPYVSSVLAKAGEYKWVVVGDVNVGGVYFNLETGVFGNIDPGVSSYGKIDLGDGWWRIYTITTAVANSGPLVGLAPANGGVSTPGANNTDGIYITGAQWEAGAFPTSYIPNLAAGTTTRNADVAVMTSTNFSNWYNAGAGSIAASVTPLSAAGVRPICQFDDTTANEIIALRGNGVNPELYIVDGGVQQAQLDAGTIAANATYSMCGGFETNSCAASQNGGAPATTATTTLPTVTQARLGSDGTNYLNGWLRNLRYWPQRIINAETQAFSK